MWNLRHCGLRCLLLKLLVHCKVFIDDGILYLLQTILLYLNLTNFTLDVAFYLQIKYICKFNVQLERQKLASMQQKKILGSTYLFIGGLEFSLGDWV